MFTNDYDFSKTFRTGNAREIPKDKNLIIELEIGTSDFINHHFKFWKYGKSDLQNKNNFSKIEFIDGILPCYQK